MLKGRLDMRQFMGTEHKSVVDLTVDRLIQYLQDEGLDDGDRLPNERTLSAQLNVGRSTLREALQRLSSRNVLEIRRGVGVFVSYKHGVADDPLGFTLIKDKERLARDLLEFRIMIEPRRGHGRSKRNAGGSQRTGISVRCCR